MCQSGVEFYGPTCPVASGQIRKSVIPELCFWLLPSGMFICRPMTVSQRTIAS